MASNSDSTGSKELPTTSNIGGDDFVELDSRLVALLDRVSKLESMLASLNDDPLNENKELLSTQSDEETCSLEYDVDTDDWDLEDDDSDKDIHVEKIQLNANED
ncbi:hypothetical protein KR215_008168 [Drosophila sulfurigaster]|nr:hypothetical protein KR215_008168 [Drosophila sulfurigaster]